MLIHFLLITGFILVHLFAGKLRFLDGIPRSSWLSFAGGIAVTYVFLHLLPEINETQKSLTEGVETELLIHNVYLIALIGLILFYGLERYVKKTQKARGTKPKEKEEGKTSTGMNVFWLHISSFAVYNALIGYLLVYREEESNQEMILFFVSMALHFLVNDYGLRQDHKDSYRKIGRWVLSFAIFVGWVIGNISRLSDTAVHILFAFLAGGVILNVLKEELPEERKSRFLPFLSGSILYAILLLLL